MITSAFDRFRSGLRKTRHNFFGQWSKLLGNKVRLDDETLDQIEELLISADMGVKSSLQITRNIEKRLKVEGGEANLESVLQVIRGDVKEILTTATPRVHPPAWDELVGEAGPAAGPGGKGGKSAKGGKHAKSAKGGGKTKRGKTGRHAGQQESRRDSRQPGSRDASITAAQPSVNSGMGTTSPGSRTGLAPRVLLVVGVNGTGKTTSIAKLAASLQERGHSILLAAADTFRAAAVEQLEVWADRVGVPCVRQGMGADPAAVVFDALAAAEARGHDIVIVDTAGRLHTKTNLMDELGKVARVIHKKTGRPPETLLVIDANTGQNGLSQARVFAETIPVDGLILTKLDGTAKGGIVVAIAETLGLPVKYVGMGEQVGDLAEFDADQFVDALFADWGETSSEAETNTA